MTTPQSLADLKEWDQNPREISERARQGLGNSLEEFGDLSGIVFNAQIGALVSGHQRVETIRQRWGDRAKIEGERILLPTGESIGIRVVQWDAAKHTAANLAANNPATMGTFTAGLKDLVDQLEREAPALSTSLNIDQMRTEFEEFWAKEKPEEDEPPEPPKIARTKTGDFYEFYGGGAG